MKKIRVLIVDDSAIVRDVLTKKLSEQGDIEIIGVAQDPFIARNKIVNLSPDVITLDIEMPKMDGLTFLEKLMRYNPLPVVVVSSVTTKDKYASIKALELGAFDIVNKPGESISVNEITDEIADKIRKAYELKDVYLHRKKIVEDSLAQKKVAFQKNILGTIATTDKIIAIGASTGGTIAIEYIFKNLPNNLPPIVVVQHMPQNYTRLFADRLNELSKINVKEAEDNEILENGAAYIAKGNFHLTIERRGASFYTKLVSSDKVQFQRPSVDVMFNSVANCAGKNALAFLLTGMGRDGAEGLLNIKNSGGLAVIQDEKSCIVWGMPKAAYDLNAYDRIIPLSDIPEAVVRIVADII
ncbi:MAG TPA: chemotaxis response regulator protein-glutamate methylesterase [Spirochaetota bacterium]|nr:chemotaxis response regulator protein-glutamate methylesterase [Spirochaetota bacterium]HOS33388.1 chemotaxis response regulator protein-glutamate methylesterase [Spirochaetota bacterium]HOS56827.1 chemotaxis response regulator protein-glutamate methylesterase [Spirochaetota bacterium]HPK63156.1 chemotaxis response regulator protein-glutamate methylesterase [Spirochaetota bacterium]HQF78914.1 chemotaxis response regulator protein-glutamate methylesterase [Spirochaetota bacterium]